MVGVRITWNVMKSKQNAGCRKQKKSERNFLPTTHCHLPALHRVSRDAYAGLYKPWSMSAITIIVLRSDTFV